MTAVVVAMNKEAVALAADSAVTAAGSKIFTTAEKLFMLAPGHSVGVVLFNNAYFMDMPWNIIIKLYRNKLMEGQHKFASLQEYAEDFISFLTMRGDSIFPEAHQAAVFQHTIDMILNEIFVRFWKKLNQVYEKGGKIGDEEIAEMVSEAINYLYEDWQEANNRYSESEEDSFVKCLLDKYASVIEARRNHYFDQLPLTDEDKRKIGELCLFLFTKHRELRYFSGIVFAGYGSDDLFPVSTVYTVENYLCGRLKFNRVQESKIDFEERIAWIIPLAQNDVAASILTGIHPAYLENLRTHLATHLQADALSDVLDKTEISMRKAYTDSIMRSVAALPKSDLAIIAETLVSMTSFMRKHSMDVESVGGPIDVAVISKKDGFVWIKRKHYFDLLFRVKLRIVSRIITCQIWRKPGRRPIYGHQVYEPTSRCVPEQRKWASLRAGYWIVN